MRVGDVTFVDNQHGFIIVVSQDPVNFHAIYTFAQTSDGGKTWKTSPLNASLTWYPADMTLQFLDLDTGWLRVREESSSNYDRGQLIKTTDGGNTWTEINLPHDSFFNSLIGDPVHFVTNQLGWIAGRTGGGMIEQNLLYRTQDGGRTWQTQAVGVVPSGLWRRVYELPEFVNAHVGLMTVQDYGYLNNAREVYVTHDGGVTWKLDSTLPRANVVQLLDVSHWIGVAWDKGIVERTIGEKAAPINLNHDPVVMDIDDMDFVSSNAALALANYQICPPHATSGQCSPLSQLLYTSDGGQTWQPLTLPQTATF